MQDDQLGPALARLRRAAKLDQKELGRRMGVTYSSVSRMERVGANPQAFKLFRHLRALGATLTDLDRELRGSAAKAEGDQPEAIQDFLSGVGRRMQDDPEYRKGARELLERFVVDQAEVEKRLDRLETAVGLSSRENLRPNGTEDH